MAAMASLKASPPAFDQVAAAVMPAGKLLEWEGATFWVVSLGDGYFAIIDQNFHVSGLEVG